MGTYIVTVTAVMHTASETRDQLRERVAGMFGVEPFSSVGVMPVWSAADALAYLEDLDEADGPRDATAAAQAVETLLDSALDNAHASVDSTEIEAELRERYGD